MSDEYPNRNWVVSNTLFRFANTSKQSSSNLRSATSPVFMSITFSILSPFERPLRTMCPLKQTR